MLDSRKDIDAVLIATPDHHHAPAARRAMERGYHVFVQKPLTYTIEESRKLAEMAKANPNLVTQMGNQGHSGDDGRRVVEMIRGGVIGPVREVHVWTNRPVWPQAPGVTSRPAASPTPEYLDWEAWLGVAPQRPYSGPNNPKAKRGPYHDFNWRGFWDFGTGAIGDMACHTANMVFMALQLGHPTKVSAEAGGVNPETCPAWAHVTIEFPARGAKPPVTLHWYEGRKDGQKVVPPAALVSRAVALTPNRKGLVDSGSIVVGANGIAYSPNDYGADVHFSTGKNANNGTRPERLPVNGGGDQGQKNEWVNAIKAGKAELALSNFDYAGLLTAAFLLGNVAIRTGKPFSWEGEHCRATDLPEAAALVHRQYRAGWDLIGYNPKA
jgi:predicted dehydrogenase